MTTTKLLYISSNACNASYPENTKNKFTFVLPHPIRLVSNNEKLSVKFKGIFIPDNVKSDTKPSYFKVHSDIVESQRSHENFDQCLARIPYKPESHFFEIANAAPLCINLPYITEIGIHITDEFDSEIEFDERTNNPVIVKLEISTMDSVHRSFTVTCSNLIDASNQRYEIEEDEDEDTLDFRAWLPAELDLENKAYQVGLTCAVLPGLLYNRPHELKLTLFGGMTDQPGKYYGLAAYFKFGLNSDAEDIIHVINRMFIHYGIGIMAAYELQEGTDEYIVKFKAVKLHMLKRKYPLNSKKGRKWKTHASVLVTETEVEDSPRSYHLHIPDSYFSPNQIKVSLWALMTSELLTLALNGSDKNNRGTRQIRIRPDEVELEDEATKDENDIENDSVTSEATFSHSGSKEKFGIQQTVPNAISIYSPLVHDSLVGNNQEPLIEIIPFVENKTSNRSKLLLYRPVEVTYHDTRMINVREMIFRFRNLHGDPIYASFKNKDVVLVLHFKPVN